MLPLLLLLAARQVEFNRDIRPILSDRCFTCHGPDATHRQAGFRLDVEHGADAVLGKIVGRITAGEMPPAGSGKQRLSAKEVEMVGRWIGQGAPWQPFWSFIPPKRPAGSGIDELVRRRGLRPSPEADRRLLIRRVSLDLTGIPPTPAEIAAFVSDAASNAYEKVVDRLLASPRYGERMAFRWMEAARYGDSNGYQTDGPREMWRWRDWVIDAFNRNMPYDRFTVEQLAGDLLPDATLDQKIASGFNRNHRTTGEGGIIPEEYRVEYVADRVQTTSTVWMGLTVGCARCHDHKYDPISQKDFYRLFAYFNQVPDEKGFVWNYGPEEPFVKAPLPEQQKKLAELDARAAVEVVRPKEFKWRPKQEWTPTEGMVSIEGNGDTADFNYLDPFTYAAWIKPEDEDGAILTRQDDYIESQGHGMFLIKGRVRFHLTQRFTDLGLRVETVEPVKLGEWQHVAVTYDGKRLASGVKIYVNGVSWPTKILFDQNNEPFHKKDTRVRVGEGGGLKFKGEIRDPRIYKRALNPDEAAALGGVREKQIELAYYEIKAPKKIREARAAVIAAQTERDKYYDAISTVMVMADGANRDTFVLKRGAYDDPGEKVSGAVPSALPQYDAPKNRLGLAKWLVDRRNPLTARVTVNRIWQSFFGTGIVKTVDDFGAQGEFPVHPELLDWLAVEFMDSGWDLKALQKKIVMSATYRQSSAATPELLEKDPDNRLLARGPRLRLGPEVIRDQALAVSGLLTEKAGGPSVKPYQPAGLWQELSGNNGYVQAQGADLYRRSLYTYWKRTVPHPYMMNFDSPNREQCAVFENRTDSPLQALDLMNDVTFVEAARKLAERMLTEGGIDFGYELVTARKPTAKQKEILMRALENFRTVDPEITKEGESAVKPGIDRKELAAWTGVASLLLNLDEAITKE